MPYVALSSDFLKAFAATPRSQQKAVSEALEEVRRDPSSANLQKIQGAEDDKLRALGSDAEWRVILSQPQKEVLLVLWVAAEDAAVAWAQNRHFEVNRYTGSLQSYEMPIGTAALPSREQASPEVGLIARGRLFSGYDSTTLLLLGVPEPLLVAARALRELSELDALAGSLPKEATSALYLLAAGFSPDATLDELDRKKPVNPQKPEFDPSDFEAALKRPGTEQVFQSVESEQSLSELLLLQNGQLCPFLTPTQSKLVALQTTGPTRVLGGPGTGKTLILLHRARELSRRCPPGKKVLFATLTAALAADIQAQLGRMCGKELEHIEVTSLHAWARSLLQVRGMPVRTSEEVPEKEAEGWGFACAADVVSRFPESFYRREWSEVVQAQGITDESGYVRARRAERGKRLSREQRKQVWEVLAAYRSFLQRQELLDPADLIREARLLLESGKIPPNYAAIVADEVQDFTEAELRLLRAMVPEGPDDLFLVGDAHQRIYGHQASLAQCGIVVAGERSRRLRLNYRSTQSLRNFCVSILRGMAVDDLDQGTDDALKGHHCLRSGRPPSVVQHATEKDEAIFIIKQLRTWTAEPGRKPSEICVTARTRELLEKRYQPLLREAGFLEGDGVRLTTMHGVKGLEFPCVLVCGVQAGSVPLDLKNYADETARQDHLDTEKRLLFVAASRASTELVVTGFGKPSVFLKT